MQKVRQHGEISSPVDMLCHVKIFNRFRSNVVLSNVCIKIYLENLIAISVSPVKRIAGIKLSWCIVTVVRLILHRWVRDMK